MTAVTWAGPLPSVSSPTEWGDNTPIASGCEDHREHCVQTAAEEVLRERQSKGAPRDSGEPDPKPLMEAGPVR